MNTTTLTKTLVSRAAFLALGIAVVIGGLALASLRSLSSTASSSVDFAQDQLTGNAAATVEALAADVDAASSRLTLLILLATVLGVVAAGLLAMQFAKKLSGEMHNLRTAAALSSSEEEAPAMEATPVMEAAAEIDEPTQPSVTDQQASREVALKPFVNLGRRSQNLLARQMSFIDAMEKDETNPENLKRLFQIDHLATRMRRNAESLLVLADESSPRNLRKPVSMHQVVQAASGEIEHFDRVSITGIADAHVDGATAHDLAHLLAELLENATSFAPPETSATVKGQPTEHGYLMEIVDHGIGMDETAMAEANARFADHTGSLAEQHSSSFLGHDVVGRLARRHGVAVDLLATPTGGVTARLHVPHSALATTNAATAATPPAAVDAAVGAPTDAEPATAFSSQVPDDASALTESFASAVPDDASALIDSPDLATPEALTSEPVSSETVTPEPVTNETVTPAMGTELRLEDYAASVPDDASALLDPGLDEVSAFETPVFETPVFDTPAPTAIDTEAAEAADLETPEPAEAADLETPQPADLDIPELAEPAEPADLETPQPAEAADPVLPETAPLPAPTPVEPAPARNLTDDQRAAIEWAMEKRGGRLNTGSLLSPGPISAGPVAVADDEVTELRAGPIDAADLDATASGLLRRRRGEEGAKHFAEQATQAPQGIPTPRSPEQLLSFRQGLADGRAKAEQEGAE